MESIYFERFLCNFRGNVHKAFSTIPDIYKVVYMEAPLNYLWLFWWLISTVLIRPGSWVQSPCGLVSFILFWGKLLAPDTEYQPD